MSLFKQYPNQWIPLNTILNLRIAQYNTRISELREKGIFIENKTKVVDGVKHSWFKWTPITIEKTGQATFFKEGAVQDSHV
ncbi:MAG: hypothetical protein KC733_12620 [Candidatus Omnitrophica bacterium]|nr:hypothetical protein [Candidatus Omnitrophota bacterium]